MLQTEHIETKNHYHQSLKTISVTCSAVEQYLVFGRLIDHKPNSGEEKKQRDTKKNQTKPNDE